MTEKSFEDLPTGDQHLQEKRISGEDIYGGIFLQMKRDKVSLPAVTMGSQPRIKSAAAMLTRVVWMSSWCLANKT
jgi:hypothetical protein